MRHRRRVAKLGRTESHRKALLRNLASQLFTHGRISTTDAKAKALQPLAERLITLAKEDTIHSRRMVSRDISDREVVKRLFSELSPRYKGCPGGYTRIMKLANRPGDNARVSIIELVEKGAVRGPVTAKEDKDSGKRGKGRRGKPAKRGIRKRLSRKEEGGERNETIGS